MKVCIETIIAFLMAGLMFACSAAVSGCHTSLPDPATTDGLSVAESKLDSLTDSRISKISASATVAQDVISGFPDGSNKDVVNGELDVILAMTGEPNKADLDVAKNRSLEKDISKLKESYNESVLIAEQLRKQINDANLKYEQEKAKKEAEYKAALKEKQIEIDQKKMELEQERLDKQAQRWNMAGGFLVLAGLGLALATPMKRAGVILIPFGIFIASIPFVMNEPWFKYSVIFIFLAGVISGILYLFKSKNQSTQVDNTDNSK